ncbi:MAG: PorP/SprF family type IX secretion system membrane protein [Bacteroidota bacterium]
MKRIILLLSFITCVTMLSRAQDPQYSMFYASPLTLNPAMTGAFSGNYRVSGIFRGQWGSVLAGNALDKKGTPTFRTYSAAVDFRTNKAFMDGDAFGFGLAMQADKAGAVNFGTIGILGSLAYHKALNRRATQVITLGFQGGVWQRSLNTSLLCFGTNYDGTGCNYSLPTDPSLYQQFDDKFLMYDVNFGLLWYMKMMDRGNAYLGFAMHHVNRYDESFYKGSGTEAKVPYKFVGHGGVTIPIGDFFSVSPKFVVLYQGVQWQTNIGTDVKVKFFDDESEDGFSLGVLYRINGGDTKAVWKDRVINSESVILPAKLEYKHITLGISYDINVGHDKLASRSKGAWEIFAAYQGFFPGRKAKTLFCPRW